MVPSAAPIRSPIVTLHGVLRMLSEMTYFLHLVRCAGEGNADDGADTARAPDGELSY